MGTPSDSGAESSSRAESGRHAQQDSAPEGTPATPPEDPPFDPYRFGRPDHPVPPEFAPPGYVPDPEPPAQGPNSYAGPPSGAGQQTPYRPPTAPYPYGQPPYGQAPAGQSPYGQSPYPQGPYPQAPYGAPPYGYTAGSGSNGKATAAMVLGIVAVLLCWLSVFDAVVIIPAIVLGFLGLSQAKQLGGTGRGMAITGLACAAVATVLAVVITVLVTNAYSECGGTANQDDPGFNQCVQDNLF